MPEKWLQFAPFLLVTGKAPTLNIARVLESLIIAGCSAVLVAILSVQILHNDIAWIKQSMGELKTELKQSVADIKSDMRRIDGKVDAYIMKQSGR